MFIRRAGRLCNLYFLIGGDMSVALCISSFGCCIDIMKAAILEFCPCPPSHNVARCRQILPAQIG